MSSGPRRESRTARRLFANSETKRPGAPPGPEPSDDWPTGRPAARFAHSHFATPQHGVCHVPSRLDDSQHLAVSGRSTCNDFCSRPLSAVPVSSAPSWRAFCSRISCDGVVRMTNRIGKYTRDLDQSLDLASVDLGFCEAMVRICLQLGDLSKAEIDSLGNIQIEAVSRFREAGVPLPWERGQPHRSPSGQ
jgi:hypothetical protein